MEIVGTTIFGAIVLLCAISVVFFIGQFFGYGLVWFADENIKETMIIVIIIMVFLAMSCFVGSILLATL